MAPLEIEGDTLGQKHRNYNNIVNETTQEVTPEINYEEPDLDNFLKIDIACKNRNVDYIIKVLQCEDMLYVSRAIKRSTWLITDPQYANIVNPNYLNDQLYPTMMSKAFNKFLLHIRLNLKHEKRVEEFFNYYNDRDLQAAFKWLPNCSIHLTVKNIHKHSDEIPKHLLKRLCEKCITYLDIYDDKFFRLHYTHEETTFLIRNNIEKYLDMVEASGTFQKPKLGPKATKLIMKKCKERVMRNLEKYSSFVHVPTFAKFIKQEDLKDFITTNIKNIKMRSWFAYGKITPLVNRLPIESRFEIIKEIFIDKKYGDVRGNIVSYHFDHVVFEKFNAQNIYRWYTYAPFNIAFVDLEKVIRSEPIFSERASLFEVMLTCAGKNLKNIHTILKYYRENHMNEPLKFKMQFVNLVVNSVSTYRFDKETWGYLNDLFCSMGVYNEREKLVQNCVRSIILYSVIHDESIPKIIEKKFIFDTFKSNQKNFSKEEREKVFLYLYKFLIFQIDTHKIDDEKEFNKTVEVLKKLLNLLLDWNKELKDFPLVLDKIKEIIQIKQKKEWNEDISILYNVKKSWRKLLFAESIVLSPTQEACINALKHGPELLEVYNNEVASLCLNDKKRIDRFLKKVRIYWSQSLANTYKDFFINIIAQRNTQKAAVIGLCVLFQKNKMSNLVQKYVPSDFKIDWSQPDDVELNLRKFIASSMHVARPQPSIVDVLLYAKGDYLQFVLPSLNAILYNMNCGQTRKHLTQFLDSPFSLQKHVTRIAFVKLRHDELKKLFHIFESTKNRKIRLTIFNQILSFICKETDTSVVRKIWEVLSLFIDNLTSEDNKSIYTKLSKAENIPMCVRPEFCMKSYKFLKSLLPEVDCDSLLIDLRYNMGVVIKLLDTDFVAEVFLELFDNNFSTKQNQFQFFAFQYVLNAKTEDMFTVRYEKIFVPMLEQTFAMLNKSDEIYIRYILNDVLLIRFPNNVFVKEKITRLIPLFTDTLNRLRENLPIDENYVVITTQKLSLDCLRIFENILKTNELLASTLAASMDERDSDVCRQLHAVTMPQLCELCFNYLREDVSNYFPSIYVQFAKAFKDTCDNFDFNLINIITGLKVFLECKDFIPGYLFVLETLSFYGYSDHEKILKSELLNEISAHPSKEVKTYCWGIKWTS